MQDESSDPLAASSSPTSDNPLTLQDQIAQLRRRRQALQEKVELQKLQQEVEDLERATSTPLNRKRAATPNSNDSPTIGNSSEPPAQRRRTDDDMYTIATRGPKIEKIPVFEGKGVREYHDFESRLGIAFRLDPSAFRLEDQKIAFTLQYLQPTLRQLWTQRELESDGMTLSWREMMSFLLDQIKSPINRELQVTILYQKSTQKETQSVNEFAAYLSTLENQINPPYEQKHLVMHLYSKLRPEIRIALLNQSEFPTTRREMVERAATLEDNLRRSGGLPSFTQRHDSSARRSGSTPNSNIPPRNNGSTPGSRHSSTSSRPNSCFHCGGTGHWARDCEKKKQDTHPASGVNAIETKNLLA